MPRKDFVRANAFTNDNDIIFGGLGCDGLNVDDGDERDELYGERAFDRCYVGARSEVDSGCNALFVDGVRARYTKTFGR